MAHISVDQLAARKRQLIAERDRRIRELSIGYDNAIAVIDELLQMAMGHDGQPPKEDLQDDTR